MTTENSTQPESIEEAAQVDQASPEATEPEDTAEETIDWQARAEQAEERLTKAETNFRSQEINLLKQEERDLIAKKQDNKMDIILEALATNDYEGARQKVDTLENEFAGQASTQEFQLEQRTIAREILSAASDMGVNADTSPEFENVRLYWDKGTREGNAAYLAKAEAEIERVRNKVVADENKRLQAENKKIREDAKKEALEEVGAVDLDTNGSATGASGNNVYGMSRIAQGLRRQQG